MTEKSFNQGWYYWFWCAILVAFVLIIMGFTVSSIFFDIYGNWWGPFPVANSIESIDDSSPLIPIGSITGCWPERRGSGLYLLRRVEDHVLIEYRTTSVSESDRWLRCPNGTRIIMSLEEWNSQVRRYGYLTEHENERIAAERRRREIERRLLAE
jgi:hypothetical protein